MKKLLILFGICITLLGCSNEKIADNDMLSNAAEFNFKQAFDFKEEKSVTLLVETYVRGQRIDHKLMSFGNQFKGKGNLQFSYFNPNYATSESIGPFLIGVIGAEDRVISDKIIDETPYMGLLFESANANLITENGDYILGVFGYLTNEDAATSFPKIKIGERKDFIEAYTSYPIAYVVIAEVR